MEEKTLKELVNHCLNEFIYKESYLIKNDLNERTITARMMIYFQKYFYDYDVDCEYNRNLNNKKEINLLKNQLDNINQDKKLNVSVNPDLIVHKRGTDNNLLIVEVKKSGALQKSINFDKEKLKVFTSSLGYKFGLFLKLDKKGESIQQIWFKEGQECRN